MGILKCAYNEAMAAQRNIENHATYLFSGRSRKKWRDDYMEEHNPALLLHGYLQSHPALKPLENYLFDNHINIDCEFYEFWKDLDEVTKGAVHRVKLIAKKAKRKVDLIGHSLGGLVSKRVAYEVPELIERAVMLGAPHKGTWAALAGYGTKSARQMLPGSGFIDSLDKRHKDANGVKFYNVVGEYDFVILPRSNALLENNGTKNVVVRSSGHLTLIDDPVHPLILELLHDRVPKEYRA